MWKIINLTGRQIKEGKEWWKKKNQRLEPCAIPSLPLSSSPLTDPAHPLCVFHHPVCTSVCLSSMTASWLLCDFGSRQKWLASQPCRHTVGHDSARLCATLCEQQCQAVNWRALLDKLGTEECPFTKNTAVYLKQMTAWEWTSAGLEFFSFTNCGIWLNFFYNFDINP